MAVSAMTLGRDGRILTSVRADGRGACRADQACRRATVLSSAELEAYVPGRAGAYRMREAVAESWPWRRPFIRPITEFPSDGRLQISKAKVKRQTEAPLRAC